MSQKERCHPQNANVNFEQLIPAVPGFMDIFYLLFSFLLLYLFG